MEKLQVFLIGALGTAFAWAFDHGEVMFSFGRWVPIILASAYTIWKWIKDIKNNNGPR